MIKLRWLNLLEDERGGGTVMGLLLFVLLVGITGMAVDATDGFRNKTGLQATADAAALAASIDLPNQGLALVAAMKYAELNMPEAIYGEVLRPTDVQFGIWDAATRTFAIGETPADAVRVMAHRSQDNGNPLPLNFLRIIGADVWGDIRAEAIAQRFVPPCLNDGLFARGMVNVSSNNNFVERICIHGEEGVDMQNHNYYETGVTVSMPDPDTMLTIPAGGMETNPGLEQALLANSYNFRMIDDLPNIFAKFLNPGQDNDEVEVIPEYITSGGVQNYSLNYTVDGLTGFDLSDTSLSMSMDSMASMSPQDTDLALSTRNVSDIPADGGEREIWHIACNWNEVYKIPSNIVLINIVIIADCRIHVGSGAVLNNVVLASTAVGPGSKPLDYQNITFASNVQLGNKDNCALGGGVQIYSAASVHFSSSMVINGLQVVAAGNVELGARDQAINGISVQAGQNITLTANNEFGLCSGGSTTTLTKVSYRLVH